ncbi:transferase [Polaromonas sp. SM01]|uniref:spermine/spermidine synthase domain-containing protein n=1 Tax=Polaromonas sp. SM01 TaxID=3085630 RepID=UPI00298122F1|nr:transferase [Polaromonas sp. SM01]MDW5441428.1 transferase [Polaromonas sp. SM01]
MKAATAMPEVAGLDAPACGDFLSLQYAQPFVHEDATGKSLHFTLGELQSRMLRHRPWDLAVDYTRTMMGFLLFQPAPDRIGMIGLGGGSLAKFCYRQLPASHMTVLEINPHVLALRREFQVPDDDARFQVIAADGALFLQTETPDFDVLLVDGFDHEGQPVALCSQGFYDDCFVALRIDGVLVVNLHYDHPDYPVLAERISRSFSGNVVEVIAAEKSNSLVFASRGKPISPRQMNLARSLAGLHEEDARQQLKAELGRVLWEMKNLDQESL